MYSALRTFHKFIAFIEDKLRFNNLFYINNEALDRIIAQLNTYYIYSYSICAADTLAPDWTFPTIRTYSF